MGGFVSLFSIKIALALAAEFGPGHHGPYSPHGYHGLHGLHGHHGHHCHHGWAIPPFHQYSSLCKIVWALAAKFGGRPNIQTVFPPFHMTPCLWLDWQEKVKLEYRSGFGSGFERRCQFSIVCPSINYKIHQNKRTSLEATLAWNSADRLTDSAV